MYTYVICNFLNKNIYIYICIKIVFYRTDGTPPERVQQTVYRTPNKKLNSIIHSSTSIEERGTLYIQKETETISIPIDTKNFFTTLDSLSLSTETLLDTNLFTTEKDFTVNSEGLTLHVLKGEKTAELSKNICESENLKL